MKLRPFLVVSQVKIFFHLSERTRYSTMQWLLSHPCSNLCDTGTKWLLGRTQEEYESQQTWPEPSLTDVFMSVLGVITTENLFNVFNLDIRFPKDYEKSVLSFQCLSDNKRKNLFCLQEINCVGGSQQVAG